MTSGRYFITFVFLFLTFFCRAQKTFPVNGIPDKRTSTYAFINARVYTDYQTFTDSAVLIVRDGVILASGKGIKIPEGAIINDVKGGYIYPSFIDPDSQYGIPETPSSEKQKGPQINSATKGAYSWNQALKPEVQAHRLFTVNDQQSEALRKGGFGSVHTYVHDGIARGPGSVVLVSGEKEQEVVIREKATACFSFKKGSSQQDYPTSEMGAIALLRQSFLDAEWYSLGGKNEEYNISIQAWNDNRSLPFFFESENKFQSLRIDKIGTEFGVKFIFKGSGDEYQRIAEIKATNSTFILPLKFPQPYDLADPYDALNISLEELKHWEMAPANPYLLNNAGVTIAFTSSGMKDPTEFPEQLRKVVNYGLPKQAALKACTYTPAVILGIADKVGALKPGMIANFLIASGDLFSKEQVILENWVQGRQYVIKKSPGVSISGTYRLNVASSQPLQLIIYNTAYDPKAKVIAGTDSLNGVVSYDNNLFTIRFDLTKEPGKGSYLLSGYRNGNNLSGTGIGPGGRTLQWNAEYTSAGTIKIPADTSVIEKPSWGRLLFPNMAYGFDTLPGKETVLFRNVTVWTNEKEGILKNTDVLIRGGKITKVGAGLNADGATVVDGTGKHLTAGIIDEHSHIAISGNVNECSHSVTSEVRIGDVIDCDDINIYRQLSGGVTTAQLLHGSCNSIGGQSAIIKLRWGLGPEKLKLEGADGFIKFALGENVKQTNFGDEYRLRYPQTRMGVEQVYMNAFQQAKEYEAAWKNRTSSKSKIKPLRDLRLEALVEILNNKRFITCHSYQQGEVTMLMRVADSMGFRVNTFTHILEGYKVADKMKAHGVGASTFSDWWAYKFEVIDAIPYNGAIMHDEGLVVAYNSDDPEMARRLNQEAAKAIKYGGVSEEEALKFVTLNPAKLLHIDQRVGSVREGKDADLVLWSDHPLSVYARVEMTFVDGIRYYDTKRDVELRNELASERSRIIAKMLLEKSKAKPGDLKKPSFRQEEIKHCIDDE